MLDTPSTIITKERCISSEVVCLPSPSLSLLAEQHSFGICCALINEL